MKILIPSLNPMQITLSEIRLEEKELKKILSNTQPKLKKYDSIQDSAQMQQILAEIKLKFLSKTQTNVDNIVWNNTKFSISNQFIDNIL